MTQYEDLQFLNILPKSIVLKVVLSSLRLISPPHSSLLILHFSKLETREPKLTKPTVKVNQKTCIEFAEAEDLMCKKKTKKKTRNEIKIKDFEQFLCNYAV